MRPDAYGILTAYGSPHLARKAEQVPQGLRDTGSSKRTCPLYSLLFSVTGKPPQAENTGYRPNSPAAVSRADAITLSIS